MTDTKTLQEIEYYDPKEIVIKSDIRNGDIEDARDYDKLVSSFLERQARNLPPIRTPIECVREDGEIVVIAGRRRLRAAILAGLTQIPVLFADKYRPLTGFEKLEHEISENSNRKDLGRIEEGKNIVALIYERIKDYPAIKEMQLRKTNPTNSDKVVAYLSRLRQSLGYDKREWEMERLRNPVFNEILDVFDMVGRSWYSYTENVLSFLSYSDEVQQLINDKSINGKGARQINKVRDESLKIEITKKITEKIKRGDKGANLVQSTIDEVFATATASKRISSAGTATEDVEFKIGKVDVLRTNTNWYYNRDSLSLNVRRRYADNFNGVLWDTGNVKSEFGCPIKVIDRLILYHTKITEAVAIVNPLTLEPLESALRLGRMAKVISPNAFSPYVSTYHLNDFSKESHLLLSNEGSKKSGPREEGLGEQSVALGILMLYPYGEVNIPKSMLWDASIETLEPTSQKTLKGYMSMVGEILQEMLRVCNKVSVICRNSSTKKGTYSALPASISESLKGYIISTNYYKSSKDRIWTVITATSPYYGG